MGLEIIGPEGHSIVTLEDWHRWAPPRRPEHWVCGRSAMELARAWIRTGQPSTPKDLLGILDSRPETSCTTIHRAFPEMVTQFDDLGEGRHHDLVAEGTCSSGRVVIGVEAKVDEAFGQPLGPYYSSKCVTPSKVPERARFLVEALFGSKEMAPYSDLKYQLLHSTVGTLVQAAVMGADLAVFLVHEFMTYRRDCRKAEENHSDFESFVRALPCQSQVTVQPGRLIGPIHVHGDSGVPHTIPLFMGWIESHTSNCGPGKAV